MLRECFNRGEWEADLTRRQGSFSQSWDWGEFQRACGYDVRRFIEGAGICQVIIKSVGLGLNLWYAPRAPVEFSNAGYAALQEEARKAKALLFRFEPEVAPPDGSRVVSASPTVTLVTELLADDEKILASMHQKTRYNIRLAERKGVIVERSADLGSWRALVKETSQRDNFRAHPDSYYQKLLATVPFARLYLARAGVHDQPLAACIAIFYGTTATYLFGASADFGRELMAPYALHFAVMREARAFGCARYDWWGVNPENRAHLDYRLSWEGITRFKLGFGGRRQEYPGTYEIGLRPWWCALHRLRRWARTVSVDRFFANR